MIKKRILTSSVVQLGLTALSLLAAYNLDRLASGHGLALSLDLGDAVTALSDRKVLVLFLLLTALSAVAVFCMAFGHSYINYRSDMQQVTPDIETPRAEGQGQYGTAKWLEKRHISNVFTVVQVDRSAPLLRKLIEDAKRGEE